MIAAHCPDLDDLQKYLSGRLDSIAAADLESHLDQCESCEQTIDQLEAESDTMVEVLRKWKSSDRVSTVDASPEIAAAQAFSANLADRLKVASHLTMATSPTIGAYQLIRLLGRGGMGAVYLARHRNLDKQVAIKLLPALSSQQQDIVARFQREIRASGQLDHPAIVRATDAGEVDGIHFLVMDAIDGLDIGQVCRNLGPLSIADACEIARQAAVGLAYAHGKGIVHRDIKPSNLMLDENGQVKILDFGLAQMSLWSDEATQLTTVGQLMGTLDYMAPEQAEGSELPDQRADIYALGATLYRLLTGRPPLWASRAGSPIEKLRLIASHDPPPIESIRGDLPPALTQLVMQMLARDPDQRPQSAEEVAERLAPYCDTSELNRVIKTARDQSPDAEGHSESPNVIPRPIKSLPPHNIWKWTTLAACVALLILGAQFTLDTSKGQLIIDSKDANLHIHIRRDGQAYRDLEIHPGVQVTKLYGGNYEIVLDQPSDNITISRKKFSIRMGEKLIATVQEKPGEAVAVNERQPAAKPAAEAVKVTAKRVKVAAVEAKTVRVRYLYLGRLQERALGFLAPNRDGVVKDLNVHLGQEVKKGDLIAEVVSADNEKEAIQAPFDAFVIGLKVAEGDQVKKGDMLMLLSASGPAIVNFDISPDERLLFVQSVLNGDTKIELAFEKSEKKYDHAGKLTKVDGEVDSHGNIELQAEFPNPEGKVGTGTRAWIEINPTLENVTLVPKEAVFRRDNRTCVLVVDDHQIAHLRDVTVMNPWEDCYVIKSGVRVGEQVIVDGIDQVQDGEKVVAPTTTADRPVAKTIQVGTVEAQSVTITNRYVGEIQKRTVGYLEAAADGTVDQVYVAPWQKFHKDELLFETLSSANVTDGDVPAKDPNSVIRAPFDGFVWMVKFKKGDHIKKGDKLIIVSKAGPGVVDFNVPASRLDEIIRWDSNNELKLSLMFSNGKRYDQPGKLTTIDGEVDRASGNVHLQAEFPNPDGKMSIGQSATVLLAHTMNNALVIPQRATFEISGKHYVFVVDEQGIAHQREIFVESETEDNFVIASGIREGEQIVLDRVREVRDGEKVAASISEVPFSDPANVARVESKSVTIEHQHVALVSGPEIHSIPSPAKGRFDKKYARTFQSVKKGELLFTFSPTTEDGENASDSKDSIIECRAPCDGIVIDHTTPARQDFNKGNILMSVTEHGPLIADFHVTDSIHEAYRGQRDLKIELQFEDGKTYGELGQLEPNFETLSETAQVIMHASFENRRGSSFHARPGKIHISKTFKDATVVPQQATFEKDGKRYLFVVDENHIAHQREIFVEAETKDQFVIQSGINAGEQIVVDGVRTVQDGERITR